MGNLNVYFIIFSQHKGRQWEGYCGYIFAKDEESIPGLLKEKSHGKVCVLSIQKVDVSEGTVLCGERWRKL